MTADSAGQAPDAETYAHMLRLSDSLREPVIRSAIRALQLAPGSRGLDAGCGIGSHTPLLAEAVGPGGHVTGCDLSPEFMLLARKAAEQSGLSERVSFREANLNDLPFDDGAFEWVWSVDCAGYPYAQRPLPLLKELARVVKPGGTVAILGWTYSQLLPGHPLLEARLNATCSCIAPYARGKRPEQHFSRALGWFRDAGLVELEARTFAGSVRAPLGDYVRSAMISLFQMWWEEPRPDVSEEIRAEYQRLCRPDSSEFILDLPDYYAFFTYSMFRGKVA